MVKNLLILFFLSTFCLNSFALSGQYYYVVKKDEYASKILYRAGLKPLYKKQGTLHDLIQNNISNLKNIDLIENGQKIYFSSQQVEYSKKLGLIVSNNQGEIFFTQLAFGIEEQKRLEKLGIVSNQEVNRPTKTTQDLQHLNTQKRLVANEALVCLPNPENKEIKQSKIVQDEDVESSLTGQIGVGYSAINGKDRGDHTTAQILSKINTELLVSWNQHWSEDFKSSFYAGYKSNSFDSQYLSTNIYNSKIEIARFGFRLEQRSDLFAKPIKYQYSLEQGAQLFYRGISGSTGTGLEINAVPVTSVSVGLEKSLFKKSRFDIGLNGSLKYLSSGTYQNYSVKSGYAYKAGIYLSETRKNKEFSCGLSYSQRKQDTSLIYFSETSIESACQMQWSY